MPSISSAEYKKLEHVFADEHGDAFDRLPIQRRWRHLCIQRTCTHLESGYPFQSLALLLRLYASGNPSLGGNRLGMVP